jgi:SpoVK/Ycf46/Vps4 family AAA+-type ATPase
VILLRGDPGCGKTHFVRALVTQWETWCQTEIVVDPDAAFEDASYLMQIVTRRAKQDRARLLVCEDLSEMLSPPRSTGLQRLLSLADGLLGHGRDLMVVLSTNLRPEQLDPALLRPGRCMANVEFRRFTADESRSLLGTSLQVNESMTLAEIREAMGHASQVRTTTAPIQTGTYL